VSTQSPRAGESNGRVRQLEELGRVVPVEAWSGGITSAILIGAFAGLMPAVRVVEG
jgi:hypothetical protein